MELSSSKSFLPILKLKTTILGLYLTANREVQSLRDREF